MSRQLSLLVVLFLIGCGTGPVPVSPTAPVATLLPTATFTPLPEPTATPEATPTPLADEAPLGDGWCSPGGGFDPSFRVVGYFPDYRTLEPGWGSCLTDLILFSVEPLANGELDSSRIRPETLAALRQMQQDYGTRLHVAVGGYNRAVDFAAMAVNPKLRAKFIGELKDFVFENRFDGVDYDWEFPKTKTEAKGYEALIAETKLALRERGLAVSVALYPLPELNIAQYSGVADRVNVMSYDRGSRHATYEQALKDVDFFLEAGLPKEKIILGIPFYGRTISLPHKAFSYSDIVQQYFPLPETDEVTDLYFNGQDTVRRKTCYARAAGLGGVMIWELGQDSLSIYSLLRSVYQGATKGCE